MNTTTDHPLLDFASRYADPTQDYLNAYMAIARLDMLLEDLTKVRDLLEAEHPKEQRWYPWFGAEIISYYAVSFVTCLEWHAKSRLIDLLIFQPFSLKIEDVKGTISEKLIVQMVARQASVIQLVGASVKVASTEKYFSIIDRVFKGLGLPFSLTEWLFGKASGATVCWIRPGQLASLDRLFDFRHRLVHEIGAATMGHPNIRDAWGPEQAAEVGSLVASILYGIEAAFTQHAPHLFPNVLTSERWPVSTVENLKKELDRLDQLANKQVAACEWNDGRTSEVWAEARESFKSYMGAEENFISNARMLHWRYFDARTPLQLRLLEYRIEFLTELLSHFPSPEGDDSLSNEGGAVTA